MKLAALIAVLAALVVSGIKPYDRITWWLEVAPVLIAAPVLVATYRRFPLTNILYFLISIHALVLLGFWLQDLLHLERNPYDRIGHFMQGFVPAMIAREILLRGGFVAGTKMVGFLSLCVALAFSAFYELIEWWAALALGQGAEDPAKRMVGAKGKGQLLQELSEFID